MPFSVFEELNRIREENGEALFANPRNAASGTLKLQNSSMVASRKLDAYFYAVPAMKFSEKTHFDNLMRAREWGLKVSEYAQVCKNLNEVKAYLENWDNDRINCR
jgi:DNA ligase (NAD+)